MATINAQIADAELKMATAGFTTVLWKPQFGWAPTEGEASEKAYDQQYVAALHVFLWMFCADTSRSWVHLAAEMQAGKTGVMCCLIRLILANWAKLTIRPEDVFTITGMSDDAWLLQTRGRLPNAVRDGVQHNGGLAKVTIALRRKVEASGAAGLRNVLIMLDESHFASDYKNRPAKLIFDELLRLAPVTEWAERNIRVLTISATDPAKILAIGQAEGAKVVHLQTDENYQSVEALRTLERLHETEDIVTPAAAQRLATFITSKYGETPLYHIIRPRQRKQELTVELLRSAFPGCEVVSWDSQTKAARSSNSAASTVAPMNDINELLADAPEVTTFVVLKNMLYASKTLDDTHVGVLHDRVGAKDDTNLQSFLGRACGYGKSKRTHVFTSLQTVSNYIKTWRDLKATDTQVEQAHAELAKKMPAVEAMAAAAGGSTLTAAARASNPFVASGAAAALHAARPKKEPVNEDHFESEWSPLFRTLDEAKQWIRARGGQPRTPTLRDGAYVSSTTGKAIKQPLAAILAMRGGKKTANMPSRTLEVGDQVCRLYVGYQDMDDNATARFVARRLRRIL
jgi:hypothetical protein